MADLPPRHPLAAPTMGRRKVGTGFGTGGVEKWGGSERLALFPMKDEIVPVEVCHSVFPALERERLHG